MYFLVKVISVVYICTCVVQGFGLLENVKYPDKCLQVTGSSKDNNAKLDITDCDKSQANQQLNVEDWVLYGSTPGRIIFKFTDKCLTVNSGGIINGDLIDQYDCVTESKNQFWGIDGSYDGHFRLRNVGSSRCVTAEMGGAYIDQWECIGEVFAPHQAWRIYNSDGLYPSSSEYSVNIAV